MPDEPQPHASLEMTKGPTPGFRLDLFKDVVLLGRGPDCDLKLRDPNKAVSNRHARIHKKVDGGHVLEDLRSLNGTFVNGEWIQGRSVPLPHGSTIRIITFEFLFQVPDEDSAKVWMTLDATVPASNDSIQFRPLQKLRGVLDICQALAQSRDQDEMAGLALEYLFRIFPEADQGLVLLETNGPPRQIVRSRTEGTGPARISRTIYDQVLREAKAILGEESLPLPGASVESIAYTQAYMLICAPLFNHERRPMGMIQVDASRRQGRFTQDDLDLLAAVAGPVGAFIENARLLELAAEVRQAERDAREFQHALLPLRRPELSGYDFWDRYEPAAFVGGDAYDYLPIAPGRLDGPFRWGVVVTDVEGKGMPAAKRMAQVSTLLRRAAMLERSPAELVGRVNREVLAADGGDGPLVTLVLAVIDPESDSLTVVRAGHPDVLVRRRDGRVDPVSPETNGRLLGFDADAGYLESTVSLSPGDMVVCFSDGVHEAMNASGQRFGMDRWKQALEDAPGPIAEAGPFLLEQVRRFVGATEPSDDLTLVLFGRPGG